MIFQKPGVAESEFAEAGCSSTLRKFLSDHTPGPAVAPKEDGLAEDPSKKETCLPSWLTEEDIEYYTSKYEKSGFTGGLNYYRSLDVYDSLASNLFT